VVVGETAGEGEVVSGVMTVHKGEWNGRQESEEVEWSSVANQLYVVKLSLYLEPEGLDWHNKGMMIRSGKDRSMIGSLTRMPFNGENVLLPYEKPLWHLSFSQNDIMKANRPYISGLSFTSARPTY